MPGGVGIDRVSGRDVEVLEFVARFGVVPREAVAEWADTARTMTYRREGRLRRAGLLTLEWPRQGGGPFLVATRSGLGLCGRGELPPARVSAGQYHHQAACARLGARLERAGAQLLSERELRAEERAWGKRIYSIQLRTRLHRPDMLILPANAPADTAPASDGERGDSGLSAADNGLARAGTRAKPGPDRSRWPGAPASPPGGGGRAAEQPPTCIEVELTRKAQGRLEEIVRLWRHAVMDGRFDAVHYYCSPGALPFVKRAVDQLGAEEQIKVELLPDEDLLATSLLA